MKTYRPGFCSLMTLVLCLGLPLAACDKPAEGDETAAVEQESLPAAEMPAEGAEVESVTAEAQTGSMDETSPAGEAVTEQEIPHSDVPPPSREVFSDAACDYEYWVGKPVDESAVKEEGRPYRLLTPDSMMTMDHNPERINVVHDADGVVTRVWCG